MHYYYYLIVDFYWNQFKITAECNSIIFTKKWRICIPFGRRPVQRNVSDVLAILQVGGNEAQLFYLF